MALERTDILDQSPVPFGKRQVRYPSPNIADLTVVEEVPISPEKYKSIPYGSPHPDYAINGLILVWQGPVKAANNQIKVMRVYSNNTANEDWYNYGLHFGGDLSTVPIYIRSYIELRSEFAPRTRGQPFRGIIKAIVTAQGAGYTPGDPPPTVVFTGGAGSGAAANAIMDEGGTKVIGFELTAAGDSYTGNPALSCTGGTGSGVAGTAFIQPATALLVKEEMAKLDSENPQLASLFVRVARVYETLPGAVQVWDVYNDERGAVQRTSQPILAVGSEAAAFSRPSTGLARKIWFEPRGDSAVVLLKIQEDWTEVVINDQATTEEYGGGILLVTERRATPGVQTPDEGLLVVDSRLETISPAEQIKKTRTLDDTEWPELVEEKAITEGLFTGTMIEIRKKVVATATTNPHPLPLSYDPPTFTEFLPAYDKWRKLQLTSKILSYPLEPIVFYTTEEVHIPSKLISTEHDWTIESQNGGASFVSYDDQIAHSEADAGTEVVPVMKILADAGFRGAALARVTRSYYLMTGGHGPQAIDIDVPLAITPSNGVAVLTGRSVSGKSVLGNTDNALSVHGKIIREIREFGPFLTAGVAVSDSHAVTATGPGVYDNTAAASAGAKTGTFNAVLVGIAGDATIEINAPASTPTSLVSGTWYIWRVNVIEGPLGLFIIEKIEIKAP